MVKASLLGQHKWGESGFPGGTSGQDSTNQCKRCGFEPRVERSPGEGNGNPLEYSRLENPMDRGACRATVHGVTEEADMT